MVSFIFLLAGFSLFTLFVINLFKRRYKKSAGFLGSAVLVLILSVVTSSLGKSVLSLYTLNKQVVGNSTDGLESYKIELHRKCKGAILDDCSQKNSSLEDVQICMFAKFAELNGSCSMFLSNAQIKYPPLTEDKVVGGILFPKGNVILGNQGIVQVADIPVAWKFANRRCGKGQVMFSHWESTPEKKLNVSSCQSE